MSIGKRLKEIRKSRGLSQDALAEQIGCSRGVITNIEHEKTEPTPLVVNAICDVLEINSEWLLTGQGSISKETQNMQSAKVLSEIYSLSKELSEQEQNYILDLITTFTKHKNHFQSPKQ